MFKILDLSRGEFLIEIGRGGYIAMFKTRAEAEKAIASRACRADVNGQQFSFLSKSASWKRCPPHLLEVVEV